MRARLASRGSSRRGPAPSFRKVSPCRTSWPGWASTVPCLLPVSIPGSSLAFGAIIALNGISLLTHRGPWLPGRLRHRRLAAALRAMRRRPLTESFYVFRTLCATRHRLRARASCLGRTGRVCARLPGVDGVCFLSDSGLGGLGRDRRVDRRQRHAVLASLGGGRDGLVDWISYWIGYKFKERIARVWPLSKHPDLLPRGHALIEKWGALGIFIGRFFGPLRAAVPLIAGMLEMSYRAFQLANFTSAFLWAWVLLVFGDVGCSPANTLRIQGLEFGREKLPKGPHMFSQARRHRRCPLSPSQMNGSLALACLHGQLRAHTHVWPGDVVERLQEDHPTAHMHTVLAEAGGLADQRGQRLAQGQVQAFDQRRADPETARPEAFGSKQDAGADGRELALLCLFN